MTDLNHSSLNKDNKNLDNKFKSRGLRPVHTSKVSISPPLQKIQNSFFLQKTIFLITHLKNVTFANNTHELQKNV